MTGPGRAPSPWRAELALVAVHIAVVAGFIRLYDDWSFLPDLAVAVVAAHVLAAICRRAASAVTAAMVAIVGLVLVGTWLLYPDTASIGVPSGATWDAVASALGDARDEFRRVKAPTEPTAAFQTVSMITLWATVWFSDWAAFRLRATIEAIAPAAVLFVFVSVLGSGEYRTASAAGFAAGVLVFVVAHRAHRAALERTWMEDEPESGSRALRRTGAAVGAVALVVGVAVAPVLPGSDDEPVFDWRSGLDDGPGDRTTVSPIVDLRRKLVDQSDAVFFRVQADEPAYWRLTALDDFDGRLWTIDEEFEVVGGQLTEPSTRPGAMLRQTFDIATLDDLWVPAAFEPRRVLSSSAGLRWDETSSTLIVADDVDGTAGLSYEIVSARPTFEPGELRRVDDLRSTARPEDLALPASFPDEARDTARQVTGGAPPYQAALALQDWFRTEFTYSTDIDAGHSEDELLAFLDAREGYCEQFAGAFAAMSRSIGIPARVAIGFTPGDRDPITGQFVVRGRHAHAWPEVWFPELGWVPFEPTPGRGMPGAEDHTGVEPAQDDTGPTPLPTPTTTTTTAPDTSTTVPSGATTTTEPTTSPVATAGSDGSDGPPWWRWPAAAVAIAAIGWLATLGLARASRRRRAGAGSVAEVLDSWAGAVSSLRWASGLQPHPAETHAEFALRSGEQETGLAATLRELGDIVGVAAWSPGLLGDDDVRRADRLGAEVSAELDARLGLWTRLRRALSLRDALDGR